MRSPRLTKILLPAALLLLAAGAHADDTDLYLNPAVPPDFEPLVMMSLDYRANLRNSVCQQVDPNDTATQISDKCGFSMPISQILFDQGATTTSDLNDRITEFEVLRAALRRVLEEIGGGIKIGFMMPHNHQANCAGPRPANPAGSDRCSNGGYIPFGFRSLNSTVIEEFDEILGEIPHPGGGQSHSFQLRETYFEFFRYLTGQAVYNGFNGWTDFFTDNSENVDTDIGPGWDTDIVSGPQHNATYTSPLQEPFSSECTRIFAINFIFGVANQDADSDTAMQAGKGSGGMGISLSGGSDARAEQVIRFMRDADLADGSFNSDVTLAGKQNVVSYFVTSKANLTQNKWANAGGTGNAIERGDDPDELVEVLTNIFQSILSVSTTFVAPSVPVNVFNRTEIANEVYLALFQAEESGLPRWPGNIKKLKIGEETFEDPDTGETVTVTELQDVNGNNAIDIDGRIRREALTFWTDATALPEPDDDSTVGTDGRAVQRGGTGQKIPGFIDNTVAFTNDDPGARQLFTDDGAGLIPLNADEDTAALLWDDLTADWDPGPLQDDDVTPATGFDDARASDQARALDALRFARGIVRGGEDADQEFINLPWMMGDPLHSQPLPINYGARGSYTEDNSDIRIAAGTNYGHMHFFINTIPGDPDDLNIESGQEAWGYVPREVLRRIDRLQRNQGGDPVHPVLTDGSPVALVRDADFDGTISSGADSDDQALISFGLRRGGKSYYALDVTNPDNPALVWKLGKDGGDFAELAQTWSRPTVGRMPVGTGGEVIDVLVFGGGYNGDDEGDGDNTDDVDKLGKDQANRDQRARISPPATGEDDDEGNALFIVNAQTGELIWKAVGPNSTGTGTKLVVNQMLDSVPANVAAVDTSGNGLLDRVYFGDTGGRVWRADIAGSDMSNWTMTLLLDAGRHVGEPDRRFFNRPDVVQTQDDFGSFDAVLIGSGDRENPLATHVQDDTFFMIKDRNINSGEPPDPDIMPRLRADLADLTDECEVTDDETNPDRCSDETIQKLINGWFIDLASVTNAPGEKNLSSAVTIGGIVFFTTFAPGGTTTACDLNEGTGKVFALNLVDASAVYNFDTTNDGDGITYERFDVLASGGIPVEAVPLGRDLVLIQGRAAGENIVQTGTATAWRTFWYEAAQ